MLRNIDLTSVDIDLTSVFIVVWVLEKAHIQ